jgi:hypothetical protein
MELGSLEALEVSMTPSPPLSEPCKPLVFVDTGGVLAPNSEVLFGKKLCDLLVSLKAVSTGYDKKITSVLTRNDSDDILIRLKRIYNF